VSTVMLGKIFLPLYQKYYTLKIFLETWFPTKMRNQRQEKNDDTRDNWNDEQVTT